MPKNKVVVHKMSAPLANLSSVVRFVIYSQITQANLTQISVSL